MLSGLPGLAKTDRATGTGQPSRIERFSGDLGRFSWSAWANGRTVRQGALPGKNPDSLEGQQMTSEGQDASIDGHCLLDVE